MEKYVMVDWLHWWTLLKTSLYPYPLLFPPTLTFDLTLWLSLVNKEITNVTQTETLKCAQVFSFLSYLQPSQWECIWPSLREWDKWKRVESVCLSQPRPQTCKKVLRSVELPSQHTANYRHLSEPYHVWFRKAKLTNWLQTYKKKNSTYFVYLWGFVVVS